MDGILGMGP
jgi:hypothetical protein